MARAARAIKNGSRIARERETRPKVCPCFRDDAARCSFSPRNSVLEKYIVGGKEQQQQEEEVDRRGDFIWAGT